MDISSDLIEKFRNGDSVAFRGLYNSNFLRLYNFAKKYLKCKEDIEEIVSEAFVKLWNLKTDFYTEHHIYSFLFKTVKNACIDNLRKQKVKVKKDYTLQFALANDISQDSDFDFTLNEIREEVIKQIYQEIEALPEQSKKIFKMAYLEGLSGQEIADRLNLSHQTVRNQIYRSLKSLRKNISLTDFDRDITLLILYSYTFHFG